MKAKFTFLCMLVCCILCPTASAQINSVSKSDALTIVQSKFQGQDVDYFILQDNSPTAWKIFVDAEPMKGWEHDCYLFSVPKNTTTPPHIAVPTKMLKLKMPPSGNYEPLSVKNRSTVIAHDITPNCNGQVCETNAYPIISDSIAAIIPLKRNVVSRTTSTPFDNQFYKDVTISIPGTLSDIIGPDINNIDSIAIKGTINDTDFNTLWSASFYGRLSIINLERATVENEIIPSRAFWHQEEQLLDDGRISVIALKKIILPNQIKSIGELAFSYAIHLESINIPSKLKNIGIYCFSDCKSLKTTPLQIPEGVTEIPAMCFMNCKSLNEIKLPSTIRHIGEGAFYQAKIKNINFPDGLLSIDNASFYATDLEEVLLPTSCLYFSGTHQFALNYNLKKINLPYGVKVIPNSFVYNDIHLSYFDIPSTIEIIGADAFSSCLALSELSLHDGVKEIKNKAFEHCRSLKRLIFPSSLTYLGGASCQYLQSVKAIYCSAPTPPVCDEDPSSKGHKHTFGPISDYPGDLCTPNDIPVYVPIGTSNLYKSAYGWNYFTNFIETDEFPTSSLNETITDTLNDNYFYDLNGRLVSKPVPGQIYIQKGKKNFYQP